MTAIWRESLRLGSAISNHYRFAVGDSEHLAGVCVCVFFFCGFEVDKFMGLQKLWRTIIEL